MRSLDMMSHARAWINAHHLNLLDFNEMPKGKWVQDTMGGLRWELEQVTPGHEDAGCKHTWKEYVGLTQVFEYCTLCDQRKDQS
jgi:hypothetical protein